MSRRKQAVVLVVGGSPRADLLPPEIRNERAERRIRRRLGLGVTGVLVIVLAGTGAATALAMQAESSLSAERARTDELLAEQGRFAKVRAVQDQVQLMKAAQRVGASTEIDWKWYLQEVQVTLPSGVTIDTVTVDAASPFEVYTQPTAPLQGARVATVGFTATSEVLPDLPVWLTALAKLPGYADALPGSVSLDEESGTYSVTITMHVNDAAFAQRYTAEEE